MQTIYNHRMSVEYFILKEEENNSLSSPKPTCGGNLISETTTANKNVLPSICFVTCPYCIDNFLLFFYVFKFCLSSYRCHHVNGCVNLSFTTYRVTKEGMFKMTIKTYILRSYMNMSDCPAQSTFHDRKTFYITRLSKYYFFCQLTLILIINTSQHVPAI